MAGVEGGELKKSRREGEKEEKRKSEERKRELPSPQKKLREKL